MKPLFSLQIKRHLRLFPQTRSELVIGNNSVLFFTLASLKMHPPFSHPQLRIVMPEFWLDLTHNNYNLLNWGQTPRGLPWYVRQEFLAIFPWHQDNELITWGQFKELRKHVIFELEKRHVQLYKGTPTIIKLPTEYNIILPEQSFSVPLDTFFYNTFRMPNLDHGLDNAPSALPHTTLYTLPVKKIPEKVILIGGGRSSVWIAEHFKDSVFACIKNGRNTLPLLRNEIRPLNLIEYPLEAFKPGESESFKLAKMNDSSLPTHSFAKIIDVKQQGRDFSGPIYCAIGLKPNHAVTSSVEKQNLLKYPHDVLHWVSSDDIPVGSLMEATQRWAAATNNLVWAYETHCYHEEYFIGLFTKEMDRAGITLPYAFFDLLRDEMLLLVKNNPDIKRSSVSSLSMDQVIQLYKDCYSKSVNNKATDEILNRIENVLRGDVQQRLERYQDEFSDNMANSPVSV